MEKQDHEIHFSYLGNAQDFVGGIMRIVPTYVNMSFLWETFIASQLEFFVKQVNYFY